MSTKTKIATAQPTQRRKRITLADVEQIAFLTEAHRMTFKEATALLGINYESWRNWKDRAQHIPLLSDIVSRVKAGWIAGRLANIKDAETGKNGHRADWRSSAWLLERTVGDRYAAQPPPPEQPRPAVSAATVRVWIENAYGALPAPPAGETVNAEVKALPAPPAELKIADGPGREDWDPIPVPPARRRMPPMFPSKLYDFTTAR